VLSQSSGLENGWQLDFAGGRDGVNNFGFRRLHDTMDALAAQVPMDRRWHAFAMRSAPGEMDIWLDGSQIKSQPTPSWENETPGPLCAGNNVLGNTPWDGDLLDLRIHDRPLSEAELRFLAASERSAPMPSGPGAIALPVLAGTFYAADPLDYNLRPFTTDHGLPSSTIQCLYQDQGGALLIGTEFGLTRFDGRQFVTADATTPQFLQTGADVGAIAQDQSGSRWLGLFHGLVRQQGTQWKSYTNLGSARFIECVEPAGDGTLWMAGRRDILPRGQSQLKRFDPVQSRILTEIPIPGLVRHLAADREGVWIGTAGPAALWRFREKSETLELVLHLAAFATQPDPIAYPPLPAVRISSDANRRRIQAEAWQEPDGSFQWVQVTCGKNQRVMTWTRDQKSDWELVETGTGKWIPSPAGLLRRRGETWERLHLGSGRSYAEVTALIPNAEGGVWAITKGDGLWLVQPAFVRLLNLGERPNPGAGGSLYPSRDGRLLVASTAGLVSRIDPDGVAPPELIQPEGGELVVETSDGTLIRAHRVSGMHGLSAHRGTNQWVCSFRANNAGARLNEISRLHVAKDGGLWIVAEKGVFLVPRLPDPPHVGHEVFLSPGDYLTFLDNLPARVFLCGLAEANDGAIWVGSAGGGLFRIVDGQVQNFPEPEAPMENLCVPLGFASDGTLWLGSETGLGAYREGRYHWVRPADGLPESVVCGVKGAEGHLWLVGQRGIHAVPREELETFLTGQTKRVSFLSLGRSDGLASTETQLKLQPVMAKTDDGQLWVMTARGVAHFDPREVLDRIRPPPVAIEELKANGRSIALGFGSLALPPDADRSVEISFSSLSFVAPERTTFRHRLVGPGTDIENETAQPYAVFPNLSPGRHVFTVKARSGHGLASYPAARVDFEIAPHFYQTPVFIGGLGLAGCFLVAGLVFIRVRAAERREGRRHERRLTAERARIAQDMHDELGAGLARLAAQTGQDSRSDSGGPTTSTQQTAQELLRSLDETVWAINPTKDHLEGVVNYLSSWLFSYFADPPPTLSLDLPALVPNHPVRAEWRHHVLMIMREVCANALKHAQATRVEVMVSLEHNPGSLTILVRDDGIGFDPMAARPAGKAGGHGMRHLRERAFALKARLHVRSTPGAGTEVSVVVPLPPTGC